MNTEAVKQEINKIVESFRESIRYNRQHQPAKWQITELTELGVIDLMPSNFGHGDAGEVLKQAKQSASAVMNQHGEGADIASSTLFDLLNEPDEPTIEEIFEDSVAYYESDNGEISELQGYAIDMAADEEIWWDDPQGYAKWSKEQYKALRASIQRGKQYYQDGYRVRQTDRIDSTVGIADSFRLRDETRPILHSCHIWSGYRANSPTHRIQYLVNLNDEAVKAQA